MVQGIRFAIGWLFTVLVLFGLMVFSAITLRRWTYEISGPVVRWWSKTTLRMLNIRLVLLNETTMADPKPRVCICNHQSTLDLFWFGAIAPPRFAAVGKKEIKYLFPINFGWWSLRLFYIDRSKQVAAIRSLERVAQKMVANSRTIVISPEGTRSVNGELGPFKSGAFHMAIQTKAPVHPMVVAGAHELMPKSAWVPKAGTILIKFLDPIPTEDWATETIESHIRTTRELMLKEYEQMKIILKDGSYE